MGRPIAATYDEALPTARDRLRFALGDTDTGAPLFPDATYDAVLEREGSEEAAKIALAIALRNKQAQQPDKTTTGPDSQQFTDRSTAMADFVTNLTPKPVTKSGKGIGTAAPVRGRY